MANIIITQTNAKIITVKEDGITPYKTWNALTSALNVENRIGEIKNLVFTVNSNTNLSSTNVYINPGLFVPNGVIGPVSGAGQNYYSFPLPSVLLANTVYTCSLSTTTSGNVDLIRNYAVRIKIIDNFNIEVQIGYIQIYDSLGYLDFTNENNQNKFLKDKKTSTSILNVSGQSIYNSNKIDIRAYIYIESQTNPLDKGSFNLKIPDYSAGFYNQNKKQTPPYFTNANWLLERQSLTVNNFSTNQNTDVTFFVNSPTLIDKVMMWIIETDTTNNTVDFINNYNAEIHEIKSTNNSTTKISAPMTGVALVSGNTYKVTYKINHSLLVFGKKYRMIAIVYGTPREVDTFKVNSFISEEIIANDMPCYNGNGLDFFGRIDDYNKEFDGNDLICVIEERLRSKIKIEYPFNKWKNNLFNRLGLVAPNDLRRYLVSIELEIYEEYQDILLGTVRNVYDRQTATKSGPLTYTTPSGMSLIFGNNYSEFSYDFRNRYEALTLNLETKVNGIIVTPAMSNQYWGNKVLTIQWKFKFTYDNYLIPFSDNMIFNQIIRVKDYGNVNILNKTTQENPQSEEQTTFCQGDLMCLKALIFPQDDFQNYRLMVNIEKAPGNVISIEEAEAWIGNQLPQLTTNKIYNEEVVYGASEDNTANFCVDTNKLLVNSQYKISALAKKNIETCRRVTEIADLRKTEYYSQRIIENCNN